MPIRSTSTTRNLEARKSSVPTIGKGKPLDARGNEGDLTFRRSSEGLKLYIKANRKWHGIKVGESFDSLEKKINEIKSKVDTIKQFKLPSTYSVTGDFTFDVSGDIELNADGGQVTIKDDTASHFLFDCDNTAFTIYDDQDSGDLFKIQIAQHGATTISTVDDDAIVGHLTLDPDGKIICKSANIIELGHLDAATDGVQFLVEESADTFQKYAAFQGEAGDHSQLRLYEAGGDSSSDYFQIKTEVNGFTKLSTVDAAGANAHFEIEADGTITLDAAAGVLLDSGDGRIFIQNAGTTFANIQVDTTSQIKLYEQGGVTSDDYLKIETATHGATTITTADAAAAAANLTMTIDGDITLDSADEIVIDHANRFKFKKAGTEYILFDVDGSSQFTMYEQGGASTDDYFKIIVATNGETTFSTVDASAATGHLNIQPDGHVEFDGCGVGFDLVTPTYNASDTDVDFTTGNKQFVTFGSGNITDLNLIFPKTSGNFILLLKQDGTGSRTVTNYKVWDIVNSDAASGSATVKFAGGSNPTLTTDANHVDIISFFYDADNQIAYGVASLDFQF